jgi:hypothetical protein
MTPSNANFREHRSQTNKCGWRTGKVILRENYRSTGREIYISVTLSTKNIALESALD